MTNTATRLITLIMLLQNKPNQKAGDLAKQLGISIRTLHRYFGMLDELGIPVYSERGPYGGFSLVRGYKLPPLIFSLEEAVAIQVGTSLMSEAWGELYRDAAQSAMAKIENILPNEQRSEINWAHRSLVATNLYRADLASLSPLMEQLRIATHERQPISMVYQSLSNSKVEKRKVDPYALIFRSGWWYLVGYCHTRAALRTFRVDRIQKLTLLNQNFTVPDDFNIHAYLEAEFKEGNVIRARLHFISEAAQMAKGNRSLWEALQENPDGSVDTVLTSPELSFLASMVMSFGPCATVLEPPELRAVIRDWAQSMADLYKT